MITAVCHFGNVLIAAPQKRRSDFTLAASVTLGTLGQEVECAEKQGEGMLVSTLELQCPQSVPGRAGLGLAGCGSYLLM